MKIATVIARILLGLMFLVFGLNGFLQFIPVKSLPPGLAGEFLTVLFQSRWVWVISAFQVLGGVFLLVNRFVPLALAILGPVIVNIITYHVLLQHSAAQPAIVATICWLLLFYQYRQYFMSLFVMKTA